MNQEDARETEVVTEELIRLKNRRPNNFTGKWRGTLYFKGKVWCGPKHELGKPGPYGFTMVEYADHKWGIAPRTNPQELSRNVYRKNRFTN